MKKCLIAQTLILHYANFDIHKQADLTKCSGLDSSIVYKIDHRVVMDQRTCNKAFLRNISGNEFKHFIHVCVALVS